MYKSNYRTYKFSLNTNYYESKNFIKMIYGDTCPTKYFIHFNKRTNAYSAYHYSFNKISDNQDSYYYKNNHIFNKYCFLRHVIRMNVIFTRTFYYPKLFNLNKKSFNSLVFINKQQFDFFTSLPDNILRDQIIVFLFHDEILA